MNKKNNTMLMVVILGGLVVTFFVAGYLVPRVLVTLTKAAPATKMSVRDSYVLGERILAKADGKDQCLINVFVMDNTGKGVAGKQVALSGSEGIKDINPVTDNQGKASFGVVSGIEGQFKLQASVEGTVLPREIVVTFRN